MAHLKVLVPLDGSEMAEAALDYLPLLAQLGTLEVRLVSVVDEGALLALPDASVWQERERRLLHEYLSKRQASLEQDGHKVETAVYEGQPAAVVADDALRSGADFLLLCTHGRSGFQRWHLGSVADKLVRIAQCNTLVVGPRAAAPPRQLRSILVPLDGSQRAEEALTLARELGSKTGAELHIVRVANYPVYADEAAGYAWTAIRDACDEYLKAKAAELHAKTAMFIGDAATEILKYVEAQHIDLIVLTSRGRGGLLRSALGSVADRLIGGRAPVLMVRAGDAGGGAEQDARRSEAQRPLAL
jgi:nucleotide-binding universal stress UspA family protein